MVKNSPKRSTNYERPDQLRSLRHETRQRGHQQPHRNSPTAPRDPQGDQRHHRHRKPRRTNPTTIHQTRNPHRHQRSLRESSSSNSKMPSLHKSRKQNQLSQKYPHPLPESQGAARNKNNKLAKNKNKVVRSEGLETLARFFVAKRSSICII